MADPSTKPRPRLALRLSSVEKATASLSPAKDPLQPVETRSPRGRIGLQRVKFNISVRPVDSRIYQGECILFTAVHI